MKSAYETAISLATDIHKPQPTETQKPQPNISERTIARLWQRMAELYGRPWEASCGLVGGRVFKTWNKALASLTPQQIKTGLDCLKAEGSEFPPNLIKFLRLCRTVVPLSHRKVDFAALPPPDINTQPKVLAAKEKHLQAVKELFGK